LIYIQDKLYRSKGSYMVFMEKVKNNNNENKEKANDNENKQINSTNSETKNPMSY